MFPWDHLRGRCPSGLLTCGCGSNQDTSTYTGIDVVGCCTYRTTDQATDVAKKDDISAAEDITQATDEQPKYAHGDHLSC